MSRVYWHTKDDVAELAGSERAWLAHLVRGAAMAAWDLESNSGNLERALEIVAMVPPGSYLHDKARDAVAQDERNGAAYKDWKPGKPLAFATDYSLIEGFVSSVRTWLNGFSDDGLIVAGHRLSARDINHTTALVVGSEEIQLASKIDGWCEAHCFIEQEDREWAADIIAEGLRLGVYRSTLKGYSQGWEQVQELLRKSDDGPVVLSYSVCDSFPSPHVHPDYPGREEVEDWDEYGDEEKQAIRGWENDWYELSHDERWDGGIAWLKTKRPWARLSPDTLGAVTFGSLVTVYDLFAPDRDERVKAAFAKVAR